MNMPKKEQNKARVLAMQSFDAAYHENGNLCVAGVDEAGRGPLAGDVYAAAVILPPDAIIEGLNDSKKLSPQKREALFEVICQTAEAYAVATASVEEIESMNILNATFLAMRRALSALSVPPSLVLVDGNQHIRSITTKNVPVVKGDEKSQSIAAASVLAKVARDRYMQEMAGRYPMYEFEKHKGYGTARHAELIRAFGPCPIHRMSFLKNIVK